MPRDDDGEGQGPNKYRAHHDDDENEESEAVPAAPTTTGSGRSTDGCLTCGSTQGLEEDVDNEGDFYCLSCWEKYEREQSQSNEGGATGTMIDPDAAAAGRTVSTSESMTPRGMSLETQTQGDEGTGAPPSAATQPRSQATQSQGLSSGPSSQEQVREVSKQQEVLPGADIKGEKKKGGRGDSPPVEEMPLSHLPLHGAETADSLCKVVCVGNESSQGDRNIDTVTGMEVTLAADVRSSSVADKGDKNMAVNNFEGERETAVSATNLNKRPVNSSVNTSDKEVDSIAVVTDGDSAVNMVEAEVNRDIEVTRTEGGGSISAADKYNKITASSDNLEGENALADSATINNGRTANSTASTNMSYKEVDSSVVIMGSDSAMEMAEVEANGDEREGDDKEEDNSIGIANDAVGDAGDDAVGDAGDDTAGASLLRAKENDECEQSEVQPSEAQEDADRNSGNINEGEGGPQTVKNNEMKVVDLVDLVDLSNLDDDAGPDNNKEDGGGEEDAWVCTQEENNNDTPLMKGALGLLTQIAPSDTEEDDEGNVSTKDVGINDEAAAKQNGGDDAALDVAKENVDKTKTGGERDKKQTTPTGSLVPVIEAAMTTTGQNSRDMAISGSTKLSQGGIPREELPRFSTKVLRSRGTEAKSQEGLGVGRENNFMSSNRSGDDGSSAHHGLTEEDEEVNGIAPDDDDRQQSPASSRSTDDDIAASGGDGLMQKGQPGPTGDEMIASQSNLQAATDIDDRRTEALNEDHHSKKSMIDEEGNEMAVDDGASKPANSSSREQIMATYANSAPESDGHKADDGAAEEQVVIDEDDGAMQQLQAAKLSPLETDEDRKSSDAKDINNAGEEGDEMTVDDDGLKSADSSREQNMAIAGDSASKPNGHKDDGAADEKLVIGDSGVAVQQLRPGKASNSVTGKDTKSSDAKDIDNDEHGRTGVPTEKETVDNDYGDEAIANQREEDESNVSKCLDNGEAKEDYENYIEEEGTGDTIVTTGSCSGGWSLYEGDTQTLPMRPSQIITDNAFASSRFRNSDTKIDVQGDETNSQGGRPVPMEEGRAEYFRQERVSTATERNDLPKEDGENQAEDQVEGITINSGLEVVAEEEVNNDDPKLTAENFLDNIKDTPRNGSLPLSYPNDHLTSPVKESPSKRSLASDAPRRNKMGGEEDGNDETTQMSQDLPGASLAPKKSSHRQGSPEKQKSNNEQVSRDSPACRPEVGKPNNGVDQDHGSMQVPGKSVYGDNKIRGNASTVSTSAVGTTPKSPNHQDNATIETKWISSVCHSHHASTGKDVNNGDCSSPRLLVPSFKPIPKNFVEDEQSLNKPSPLNDDGAEVDDVCSDNESWQPGGRVFVDDSDLIDDTHEVERTSTFKRISRGTFSSFRSSRARNNDSFSKISPPRSSERPSKSYGGTNDGTASDIKQKVHLFKPHAKYDDDDDDGDASSHLAASESSAEAEFTDGYAYDTSYFQQSQTDRKIMEQLREMKDMTSYLPSVEEMQEMASRKRLLEEMTELKKSHKASINTLKRENKKLVAELKNAKETIKQKDDIIKEKSFLLEGQFKVIAQFKSRFQGVSASKNKSSSTTLSSPSLSAKHTPVAVAISKRGVKNAEEKSCDSNGGSDDVDEDDGMTLSALKNPLVSSSSNKRRRGSYGFRQVNNSPVSKRAKRLLSPKLELAVAAAVTKRSSSGGDDTTASSIAISPISNVTSGGVMGVKKHSKKSRNGLSLAKIPSPAAPVQQPRRHTVQTNKDSSESPLRSPGHTILQNDTSSMDDTRLCGKRKLLTLESAQTAINILANFVRDSTRFNGTCFGPLWGVLKEQGKEFDLNWKCYEGKRDVLSEWNWCYVPPKSDLGAKGALGKDYFSSEEQVVLCVIKELSTITKISTLYTNHSESLLTLLPVLTRAVDDNMKYEDATLGKSPKVRTCRGKSRTQTVEDLQSNSGTKGKSSQKKGQSLSKKRASKITPESKPGSTKKQKATEQPEYQALPSFHLTQTQNVNLLRSPHNRRSQGQNSGPLEGYSFFYSGVDPNFLIEEKIERLGGRITQHNTLTVEKARHNSFFLSDYTSWRKTKYIYAASLGVPMLHYKWLVEMEQKFQEHGKAKVFDSELYVGYRLPLGLDLSQGCYPLQRASNARCWNPPGCDKRAGKPIFEGLTIALSLAPIQQPDWKMILKSCGATVKSLSDIQKNSRDSNTIDCCLFASTSLPPHVVSKPAYVSKLMKLIGDDVPLLDLAWAHQSIIQRKCLPLRGDARYSISLDHGKSNTSNDVFSIKSKAGIRYEVGDLIQFSRGAKTTSRGRVVGIILGKQKKGCKMDIKLLESAGGYGLVDCPLSAVIPVDESKLQGIIMMLGSREFNKLKYLPENPTKSNIFNQIVPSNEYQI